jgi:prepilin-type N-terminal cleavage/methylation domain-containing protein
MDTGLKKRLAFSLIELIVVVAILGMLAAMAIPAYKEYSTKSKMVVIVGTLNMFKDQIIKYYDTKGEFPDATAIVPDSQGSQLVSNGFSGWNINVPLAQSAKLRNLWYGYDEAQSLFYMHAYLASNAYGDANRDGKIIMLTGQRINGVWNIVCGNGTQSGIFIEKQYLPPGCNS